ncbi:27916_t:CDS:1, partial [Gigaspora margarita]
MNLIQNYEQCHLHETPSEPLNKVNLYELFSESSVQDNLLSNSDHLHELFSKSEVIDLSKVRGTMKDVSLMNTCKCRCIVVIVF